MFLLGKVDIVNLVGLLLLVGIALLSIGSRNKKQKYAKKALKKAVDKQLNEPMTLHPEIDPAKCGGCGACTKVCPEGDILQLINHKAVLVSPSKCVGHGECERACPFKAIDLVFGTNTRGVDIPRLTTNYETNVPGLYIAGELGGMGLIRNAVKQGALAAEHACESLKKSSAGGGAADVDLLVVGAGPAGLTACLTAIVKKRSYKCIEQNSFGGTVNNFPRQKVVMTHPAQLPLVGTMKFAKNRVSKEELLEYWMKVKKKAGVKIDESVRFEGLERDGRIFVVKTSKGNVRARKVLLCMGVRGSPRRLGLANEDLPKVTYNLIDPQQYQDKDIVVVGGGNAAVEAAQYLAKEKLKNRVKLLVRGNVMDRCHEDNRKIIEGMAAKGLIEIWHNSSLAEIQPTLVKVNKASKVVQIKNDFVFIFAGAELPYKFLMSLGVEIDKKYGEKLGA